MKRDRVARRFEIQAVSHEALAEIVRHMNKAKEALASDFETTTLDTSDVDPIPMMSVRVTGPSSAVAKIRASVSPGRSVKVLRDWLEVLPGASRPDEDYPDRRALVRIDPEGRSRDVVGSGERVVVAIVDSGLAVRHPALEAHVWTETVNGRKIHGARRMGKGAEDYDVTDQDGHGTKLAGTILDTANRVKGLELLPVKFFDFETQPLAANAARAIHFALDKEASIINLSFDLGIGSQDLREAFQRIEGTQTLVVIAAGNTGSDNDEYPLVPSCYAAECPDNVVTVMATDLYDEKPTFSNFGQKRVDLAAPGVDIMSTRPVLSREQRPYGRYTGTSAAAALVTGAVALLRAQKPGLTPQQLKTCLRDTIDPLPRLKCVNGGRLNLGRALSWP